jgi:hypothetical protein
MGISRVAQIEAMVSIFGSNRYFLHFRAQGSRFDEVLLQCIVKAPRFFILLLIFREQHF